MRLRDAVSLGPVLVGPVDAGFLSYNPNHLSMGGGDHFVMVLAVEEETVLLHDPNGFPCAILPFSDFLPAWKAEHLGSQTPYTLRWQFQRVEQVSRAEMIARTLPAIRANLVTNPGGPVVYGGSRSSRGWRALCVTPLRIAWQDICSASHSHWPRAGTWMQSPSYVRLT